MSMLSWRRLLALAAAMALVPAVAAACPFCSAVSQTFTEEMNTVNVAVIAKLVEQPPQPASDAKAAEGALPDVGKTKFEIVQVIKGQEAVGKTKQIEVLYFGQQPKDTKFLILGIEPPDISWNAPVPLSERAVEYVTKLPKVPEQGADRLAFFQEHLEDSDELLARDAYDEFAKAPYSDVKDLKDRMKHDKLVEWIQDKNVLASRRRLYLTMLGVCGTEKDVPMLEDLITREEPNNEPKTALDALVACYLTLKGPDGLPLIEERFLKDEDAEYTDTYSTIMALRFHGQEEDIIPKERLVKALRHMLDRPQMADLVIPDLARWQDWESMEKMVRLFKEADEKSSWVRVPVVQFLKACPLPEAQEKIAELEKIDPESVKRASFFVPLGPGKPMETKTADASAASDQKTAGQEKSEKTEASGDPLVPAAAKPRPTAAEAAKSVQKSEKPAATATSGVSNGPEPNEVSAKPAAADANATSTAASASQSSAAATPAPAANAADKSSSEAEQAENSSMLIFVPIGVGVALFAVLLAIVRGGSPSVGSEVKT